MILKKFIKTVAQVDLKLQDEIDNVLLEERLIEDDDAAERKREADEFLENVRVRKRFVDCQQSVTLRR